MEGGAAAAAAAAPKPGIGRVLTCGLGKSGAIGLGDRETRHGLVRVPIKGDVVQISAGGNFMAAVTADGSVFTWGAGTRGRLGHGSEEESLVPKRIAGFPPSEQIVQVAAGEFIVF
jgi:alpha-tubulin suppressor-like RCC1 family protein